MTSPLSDRVGRWVKEVGIDPGLAPPKSALIQAFRGAPDPCRPGADPRQIDDWEERHGFALPRALRVWLSLSNGFYRNGPLIHPLSAIGPMVPFARVPGLFVQPESWFELGNPNVETVCIDLGYQWPEGGRPIFTSGDDASGSGPRIIAPSFESWFLELLHSSGREFWFEGTFRDLGHPWIAHRRHTPTPALPPRLVPYLKEAAALMGPGVDDHAMAATLGLSRGEVEILLRHLQHDLDPTR
ncbi:MAG: SMI1/KNR4 family protein [Isosphaeraceae bacterium]